jgi:CheY-like chemotaxis protein
MAPVDILIVEDDSDIRESLSDFLTYEGYQVHTVENGEEGLTYLTQNDQSKLPNLIFLDLMMPVMDGGTMLQMLKSEHPEVKVPVVILSATVNKQISHNVVAYMKKPVDLDDLMIHVQKFSPKP